MKLINRNDIVHSIKTEMLQEWDVVEEQWATQQEGPGFDAQSLYVLLMSV